MQGLQKPKPNFVSSDSVHHVCFVFSLSHMLSAQDAARARLALEGEKNSSALPAALVAYLNFPPNLLSASSPTQHTKVLTASTSSAPWAINCQQAIYPTPLCVCMFVHAWDEHPLFKT